MRGRIAVDLREREPTSLVADRARFGTGHRNRRVLAALAHAEFGAPLHTIFGRRLLRVASCCFGPASGRTLFGDVAS